MADAASNGAEELAQAYNQAISSGFAIADAGMAQTAASVKIITDAIQTERDEYGKAVEKAAGQARARGENFVGVMQSATAAPAPGTPAFTQEARESFTKLVEGEMAFYQAWGKGWTDYFAGVEQRRSAAAKAMLQSNAKMVEAGQEAMKSAAKFGEALFDWSAKNAKGANS